VRIEDVLAVKVAGLNGNQKFKKTAFEWDERGFAA